MTIHDAIVKAIAISLEKERQKQAKTQEITKPIAKTTVKKRVTNWNAIELNIKKYDSLSQTERTKYASNWSRTIPYLRKILELHKKGLSNAEIKRKMDELKNEKSR